MQRLSHLHQRVSGSNQSVVDNWDCKRGGEKKEAIGLESVAEWADRVQATDFKPIDPYDKAI